ncbi:hypothetical protein Acor_28070 [Acrocarpospora corrugata]|uniref:Uncharacterized protein n=1 Tax=Acrocarpospora corrugata TaxID=35763 RepID=A0A5M3W0D4_9ACTN|nr:NAD(P)-binding protein [Acrocarpospora corrugata]GES00743.1 hypothetical protein Acor_28070 [Acrocarpospora corrugata]
MDIAVAGSGLAGLSCAIGLGRDANVVVYERLPVIGGEHWDDPAHRDLRLRAERLGVGFAPGTQVVRWEGDRLLAVGQSGGVPAAGVLVVATGHRPRTRAELGVNGARTGGVLPATVALHLLERRVRLGHDVVILGGGHWARDVAAGVIKAGTCTVIGSSLTEFPRSAQILPEAQVIRTIGTPRIRFVELSDGHRTWTLACDSLVLADGHIPYRNIDGAVLDRPDVVFAQGGDERDWDAIEAGAQAATRALDRRPSHRHVPTTLRIGHPS